ncbi:M16 family metallopeptidase [Parerythrobacter jejuensis]|uniref:Insulinase family protein n=1 Tax=Parerythrobacter jejuensis TaxID=795812 RepID=A0A845AS53_9SPHN|nr:M16 family metallopeptidase [Parerythrobacter jejuensis]MXP31775.1 insulinase family protein [Parerythrobacter jejuensis]
MKGLILAAPLALIVAVPLAAQETATATASEAAAAATPAPTWAFEESDLAAEDGYVFGQLDNGMRYVIRQNATPEGTGLVRMEVGAGRLDERDNERGLAHFVEHMAFNGSTNVPEGEMVKLLERLGLAFGADTNAATAFDYTQYRLDLPNNDPELLGTALMLMRETASELLFDVDAVERERGVLLAERRDRTTFARLNAADQIDFFVPGSQLANRFPVIDREDIGTADAATLKGFWERNYIPEKTTLVVVGDFDPAAVEAAIRERFGDWQAKQGEPQPGAGPINPDYKDAIDIYVDPALDEQITLAANAEWIERKDTAQNRRDALMRSIGYSILGRRFTRLTRSEEPPFRSAGVGTSDVFEAGRQTTLSVNAIAGRWEEGLQAAVGLYRQFLAFGVTEAEIAEQIARRRTGLENAIAGKATRSHAAFVGRAINLARNDRVPTSPDFNLALFEQVAAEATPKAVMAAVQADLVPLEQPLIRYQGRTTPEGGEQALRSAWDTAMAQPVAPLETVATAEWNYTEFGAPGSVVSDETGDALGIRRIIFDNGVRLNLKKTALQEDRVSVAVTIDGGNFLESREQPLLTDLTGLFAAGGLGQYSQDELQSVLAGRSASFAIGSGTDSFRISRGTTPRDLELQLQLIAAYLTDPGYRPEPITRFRNSLDDFYARVTATPSSALGNASGAILSDNDPRFTLPEQETFKALDFDVLRDAISDRLAKGAMEVAIVGDFDEARAIDLVAKTLAALPEREAAFRDYPESRKRTFTAQRGEKTIYHDGERDQALVSYVWPTRDYADPVASIELNMLRAVIDLEITEALREKLGKAYSPGVGNSQSRYYDGYGTFGIRAGVEVNEVEATREAIEATVARLRQTAVSDDVMQRARQPILEGLDNTLKTNGSWMRYTVRAQSQTDTIPRYLAAKDRYTAVTAERLREVAEQYLTADGAVKFVALPRPEEAASSPE